MDSEKRRSRAIKKKNQSEGGKPSEPMTLAVRLQRNQAEKQRRDRLNGYITELSNIVPMVKNSSKPVDKVSVLRLAAAHMRLNYSCLNPKNFNSNIPALPAAIQSYLEKVEKNIGGFIIVTTLRGIVLFCSRCIKDFVGFQSIDLIGQCIYNYVKANEQSFFKKKVDSAIARCKKENLKSKVVKLHMQQRPSSRSTEVRHRKMLFKLSVHCNNSFDESLTKSTENLTKVKHRDFGAASVVLMFVEPMKIEPKINRAYLLSHQEIYFTIHGLQGQIMYADQRIATITGYMPKDVQGISAYQYILDTDVPIALFAQKAMFSSNDGTGLITYRLKIFDLSYIYLQSKGQIIFKEGTTEISHFECYNKRLSDEEGSKELKKFQERFAPQINKLNTSGNVEKAQSSTLKPLEDDKTVNSLKSSEDFCDLDKASPLTCSANGVPNNEICGKDIHLPVNNNQPPNICSKFEDTNFVSNDKISTNYSANSSVTYLNGTNNTFTYSYNEYNQRSFQKEINSCSAGLIESQASTLQNANSDTNGLGYTGKLEVPHDSSGLNGKSDSSYAFLQSRYVKDLQSAFKLNFPEFFSGFDSGNHCIGHSSVTPESKPSLGNELASCPQVCGSACSPVNRFCMNKQKSPNIMNTNVIEKAPLKSAPTVKYAMSEHSSYYSRESCNSSRFVSSKSESNGHYNLDSTYTSPKSCDFQNIISDGLADAVNFSVVSGALSQAHGTDIDLVTDRYASFNTFSGVLLNGNNPSAVQKEHSMYTSKDFYNYSNGFDARKGAMNENSHTEVHMQNVSTGKSVSFTNDTYLNPDDFSAKRMKIDNGFDDECDHIYDWLNANARQGLYPDINMFSGTNNLSQDVKTYSHVKELYPTQNNGEIIPFNRDLYTELDTFFEQLPLSSCTTQSQLSCALVQSTDDKSQLPQQLSGAESPVHTLFQVNETPSMLDK
ncbi:hypothetical protein JTE90_018992 [Oedothorax gibbosus]|uniref:Aryl hydrocarbon receptor nuclear translocator-like protein 1 n=1 Tax=Oedothorax gibbosus TaxID=931172 RepID=A0AAV6U0A4_9ARAC|nr:hypothetical protein JTE90_018992 [Oedothorax gibbosus]